MSVGPVQILIRNFQLSTIILTKKVKSAHYAKYTLHDIDVTRSIFMTAY